MIMYGNDVHSLFFSVICMEYLIFYCEAFRLCEQTFRFVCCVCVCVTIVCRWVVFTLYCGRGLGIETTAFHFETMYFFFFNISTFSFTVYQININYKQLIHLLLLLVFVYVDISSLEVKCFCSFLKSFYLSMKVNSSTMILCV